MKTVPIHTAKTNLSRLIEEACRGDVVVIARGSARSSGWCRWSHPPAAAVSARSATA